MDDSTDGEPSSAAKAPGGDQKELGGGRWGLERPPCQQASTKASAT